MKKAKPTPDADTDINNLSPRELYNVGLAYLYGEGDVHYPLALDYLIKAAQSYSQNTGIKLSVRWLMVAEPVEVPRPRTTTFFILNYSLFICFLDDSF